MEKMALWVYAGVQSCHPFPIQLCVKCTADVTACFFFLCSVVVITSLSVDIHAFPSLGSRINLCLLCVGDIVMKTLNKWEATAPALTCVVWWQAGDMLIITITCVDAKSPCQSMSAFPVSFSFWMYNISSPAPTLTSGITSVLASHPHFYMRSEGKRLQR